MSNRGPKRHCGHNKYMVASCGGVCRCGTCRGRDSCSERWDHSPITKMYRIRLCVYKWLFRGLYGRAFNDKGTWNLAKPVRRLLSSLAHCIDPERPRKDNLKRLCTASCYLCLTEFEYPGPIGTDQLYFCPDCKSTRANEVAELLRKEHDYWNVPGTQGPSGENSPQDGEYT